MSNLIGDTQITCDAFSNLFKINIWTNGLERLLTEVMLMRVFKIYSYLPSVPDLHASLIQSMLTTAVPNKKEILIGTSI